MSEQRNNPFEEFLELYGPPAGEEGPVRFVREVLAAEPDDWQEDVLRAYGRGERRISIRACHGPGKTAVAAWLVVLQLLTRYPQKAVATAPSSSQLKGALVPEVKMWLQRCPEALQELFDVKAEGIYLRADPNASFFEARTARQETPEALQGVHSDHVLLVGDEASGIPEAIFNAAEGSMSGENATTLLLGNPVRSSGFFFDTFHKTSSMWYRIHVGYWPDEETRPPGMHHSPRVVEDFARAVARRTGEDSNEYRIRVLGEFPKSDLDTVIPYEMVESARNRDLVVPPNAGTVWGLDVARYGDDKNALVRRTRLSVLPEIDVWGGVDIMQTAGRVKAAWDETPPEKRPDEILIDVIGMGAGVVDRLLEQGLPIRGINVAESAAFKERYRNLRAELWFAAREWLATRDHSLPRCEGGCSEDCPHETLAQELVAPKYVHTSTGKLLVESKSDMKKRGVDSPNIADAFILTFASEPAALIHGSGDSRGWSRSWNQPITRGLAVV